MFSSHFNSGRRISRSCPCKKTKSPSRTALRSRWSSQRGLLIAKKFRGNKARMRERPGPTGIVYVTKEERGRVSGGSRRSHFSKRKAHFIRGTRWKKPVKSNR